MLPFGRDFTVYFSSGSFGSSASDNGNVNGGFFGFNVYYTNNVDLQSGKSPSGTTIALAALGAQWPTERVRIEANCLVAGAAIVSLYTDAPNGLGVLLSQVGSGNGPWLGGANPNIGNVFIPIDPYLRRFNVATPVSAAAGRGNVWVTFRLPL